MAKKLQPRTDAKRALRTLTDHDLAHAAGGFKPGQYTSSWGGGGGSTSN